jgi:hypothetical protein
MRILGKEVTVQYDNKGIAGRDMGETDPVNNLIWIKASMPEDQRQATLLHEIIEYINEDLELKLKHHQISGLATALHAVASDNRGAKDDPFK